LRAFDASKYQRCGLNGTTRDVIVNVARDQTGIHTHITITVIGMLPPSGVNPSNVCNATYDDDGHATPPPDKKNSFRNKTGKV
jgi:hypothetical protein